MNFLHEFEEFTREYPVVFLVILSVLLALLLLSFKVKRIPVEFRPANIAISINNNISTIFKYFFFPLGMIGVGFYLLYELRIKLFLTYAYPFSMPTSVFTLIFELCFLLFAIAMFVNALREYHAVTLAGFLMLLFIAAASFISHFRSPDTGLQEWLDYGNTVFIFHTTPLVLVVTILILYLLAIGFRIKEKMVLGGFLTLIAAAAMTFFSIAHIIESIRGLSPYSYTTHILFYTQLTFIFCLSYAYTFKARIE